MTTTAYTALEQLLVFQALRAEGVHSNAIFNRISDQLKAIPLVTNDTSYDSGRLSPDALRELYVWLLKEEVKADLDRRLDGEDGAITRNGDGEMGSRKRKLPSPKLATVHEASEHAHLIPQLVTRLYARYRELAVREIKEAESRYDNATKEIGEIEAGKWDERLQRQRTSSATQSPRPSSKAHTQAHLSNAQANKSGTASPAAQQDGIAQPPPKRSSTVDALLNHGPEPANGTPDHRRNSSNTTLPPLSEMAPQSPRFGIPPKMPSHPSHQMQHGHPYNQSPTHAHQSPYPPPNGINSPSVQQSLSRPTSSSSTQPFLPPPHGMALPPPPPPQYQSPSLRGPHQPPQQQRYAQPPQHRLSTSYSPTNERASMGYPPPHQAQQPPPNYYPPQQAYDRRASYPAQQQPYGYPPQAPHPGGYQMQPFTVDPQDPARGQAAQPMMQQSQHPPRIAPQTPVHGQRPPGQYAPYPAAPATLPRLPSQGGSSLVSDILSRLGTPPPSAKQRPLFKQSKRLSQLMPDKEMPSPVQDIEPLSPVQNRAEPDKSSARSTRNRDAEPAEAEPPARPTRGRGRAKRDRSPHSVVSSTADESARMTRSHSVSTAGGAVLTSDDRPGSKGDVKLEPSTPAGLVDDHENTAELQSGTGPGRTRKRRGTLQSQPQPPSKRRRQESLSAASDDRQAASPGPPPPPRPSTVMTTRNFNKTSQTIMNDINSHKHASYFAHAVRDKDAPGYADIIKVPQNLKSIRAAISAGTKAVASAATATSPSASAGADGSTVELERTVDLIPPKAIVNPAQLEKEVMRMFANAIMFNPGEDGLVSDTREMAEDVERQIREWRGFETDKEKDEVVEEEASAVAVEEEGRGSKRRKL